MARHLLATSLNPEPLIHSGAAGSSSLPPTTCWWCGSCDGGGGWVARCPLGVERHLRYWSRRRQSSDPATAARHRVTCPPTSLFSSSPSCKDEHKDNARKRKIVRNPMSLSCIISLRISFSYSSSLQVSISLHCLMIY